ncbi:MAG: hypothetical protein Q7J78_05965 [Clostridiales bacterium]|nr:hypothetical protein [Clostridiales bacterium]
MMTKLLFSALFAMRNLGILVVSLGFALLAGSIFAGADIFAFPGAFAVYIASVVQSLSSRKFHENFNHKQKIRHIQDMNYLCLKLSNEGKKNANSYWLQKMKKVVDDKDDILESFFRGERNYLKEKIVDQSMNLVVVYLKLFINFCRRNRELSELDMGQIVERVNENVRKLSFMRDPLRTGDLRKVIDMDEKIINNIRQERVDLERTESKLGLMEGSVNMFKHRIITSIESEEMLSELETVVNEAEALDTVLEERRKEQSRNRLGV